MAGERCSESAPDSNSLTEIRPVIFYFPFHDLTVREQILSTRWEARLNVFLKEIRGDQNSKEPRALKAQEVVRLLSPKAPPSSVWDWAWTPPLPTSTLEATQIAEAINSHISTAFYQVPFTEWVRVAGGYTSEAAASLVEGVSNVSSILTRWFQELSQPRGCYQQVETVSYTKTPKNNIFTTFIDITLLAPIGTFGCF